jgi:hypothetical protein
MMDRTDQVILGVTAGVVLVAGAGYFYERSRHAASTPSVVQQSSRRSTTAAIRTVLNLTVNGSQFRTNEAVTVTLTATPTITHTGSLLQLVDLTTGRVVGSTGYGTTLSVTTTHGTTTTRTYQGRLLRGGIVVARSNLISVTWQDTANGTNIGYKNASGGSVTLTATPGTVTRQGTKIHLQAASTGMANPVYAYWWLPPGGAWQTNGGYIPQDTWTIDATINGTWYVTAYATAGDAPHPETSAQRAIYEAKANTLPVIITDAPTTPHTYTPRATGRVAANVPSSATIGQVITIHAVSSGITDPVYQFWWETPSGQWQSDGVYRATNQWPVALNSEGTWHVIVYARPASAPANEDAQQRALYEVSSPVYTVSVHTAAVPQ